MADHEFVASMLKAHNDYRKLHGVPALTINKDLNRIAQAWANQLARTNKFEHSRNQKYQNAPVGENLASKWTSNNQPYTGHEATKQWYDEISMYSFTFASGPGTGHFTQLVWRDSRQLGVGKAQCRDGKWVSVAEYFPAGNYVGKYRENVVPVGSKPSKPRDAVPKHMKAPKGAATAAAPPPAAANITLTTTTSAQPRSSGGPRGWFGRSTSTPANPKGVNVVRTREIIRDGEVVIVEGSRPTFTTTVVTEQNPTTVGERRKLFNVQLSTAQASSPPSYSARATSAHAHKSDRKPPPQPSRPALAAIGGHWEPVTAGYSYSKTVMTTTVTRPDGSRAVTTKEVVKGDSTPGFGKSRPSDW